MHHKLQCRTEMCCLSCFCHYKWGFVLLLISLFPLVSVAQTKLLVTYYNNTEQLFSIAGPGKIYFQEADLVIEDEAENRVYIDRSVVRKINLFDASTSVSLPDGVQDFFFYLSPANDLLYIIYPSGERMDAKIYSVTGVMLLSRRVASDDPIDIGKLGTGVYLLRINGKTYKFNKR